MVLGTNVPGRVGRRQISFDRGDACVSPFRLFRFGSLVNPRLDCDSPRERTPRSVRCVSCQQIGLLSLDPLLLDPHLGARIQADPPRGDRHRDDQVAAGRRTPEKFLLLQSSEIVLHQESQARALLSQNQRSGLMKAKFTLVVPPVQPRNDARTLQTTVATVAVVLRRQSLFTLRS